MTDTEIRTAIAEACGERGQALTRDYPNDLNAMHEAVETLRSNQFHFVEYPKQLFKVISQTDLDKDGLGYFTFNFINATASQRAEAFLRTLGKWKEEVK